MAATLLGADTADSAEHTYTEIIDGMRQHGADAQADIEELDVLRCSSSSTMSTTTSTIMASFTSRTANGDSPPRLTRIRFRIARELKTWISEETGPVASIDALMSITPYCGIEHAAARRMLADVERAVSRWRESGREIGFSIPELEQFSEAFESSERDAVRKIITGTR